MNKGKQSRYDKHQQQAAMLVPKCIEVNKMSQQADADADADADAGC